VGAGPGVRSPRLNPSRGTGGTATRASPLSSGSSEVSIRPEGRGVLQHTPEGIEFVIKMSQSVPRDGGYCNSHSDSTTPTSTASQSVPRDGGYCNKSRRAAVISSYTSQSVPRDGGYCNQATPPSTPPSGGCLNPSRGTGGTATRFLSSGSCRRRRLNPSRGTGGTATRTNSAP